MCKENLKFKRGQVWWIRRNSQEEQDKIDDPEWVLAAKTRPWLIVSNNDCNRNYGQISMVPIITSYNKNELKPYNVGIFMNDEQRYAKCSEVQTFNWFQINGEYEFTVDKYTMEKVETAISEYLGMRQKSPSLKDLDRMISEKINEISRIRTLENHQINDVLDHMNQLLHISGVDSNLVINNTSTRTPSSSSVKSKPSTTHVINNHTTTKGRKGRWTAEAMKQFCELYKENKFKAIDEFGLSQKSGEMYFYKFQKKLAEMVIEQY